jgi:hypothetical protein
MDPDAGRIRWSTLAVRVLAKDSNVTIVMRTDDLLHVNIESVFEIFAFRQVRGSSEQKLPYLEKPELYRS